MVELKAPSGDSYLDSVQIKWISIQPFDKNGKGLTIINSTQVSNETDWWLSDLCSKWDCGQIDCIPYEPHGICRRQFLFLRNSSFSGNDKIMKKISWSEWTYSSCQHGTFNRTRYCKDYTASNTNDKVTDDQYNQLSNNIYSCTDWIESSTERDNSDNTAPACNQTRNGSDELKCFVSNRKGEPSGAPSIVGIF